MSPIRVIALDFDNCIALEENGEGSEEVKDRAWFTVFPEIERVKLSQAFGKIQQKIAGGKGDRRDVIEFVFARFCTAPVTEEEISNRSFRFNNEVQDGIKKIRIPDSTKKTLQALSKRFPLYINTATPRDVAQESLRVLGLLGYSKEVLGRPGTKSENLRSILRAEQIQSEELLFVDDQPSGWESAHEVGCQFIGIRTKRNTTWDTPQPFHIISSLAELCRLI